MSTRITRSVSIALVLVQLFSTVAWASPAKLGSAADVLKRVPAEQRAKIEAMLPRMSDGDARGLADALRAFDRHSTFWHSLKWATGAGAVLTPLAGVVGIGLAGKILGNTALASMAWGGPAIWAIGAAAGAAGWVGLMYYNHSKHWGPKALAALDAKVSELEGRAAPAAAAPAAPADRALAAAPGNASGVSLLGVGGR